MEKQASMEIKFFPKVMQKKPYSRDQTWLHCPGCSVRNGTLFLEEQMFSAQQDLFQGKRIFKKEEASILFLKRIIQRFIFSSSCISNKNKDSLHNSMLSHPKSM